jgi:predicted lipase
LADDVSAKIESELSAHSDYSLIVTGHSLGAGIAAIATAALTGLGHEMTTYTFGEPKNGDQEFADYLESLVSDDNYYRITHANDGVPQIPPALLDYVHHGAEYWQKQSGMNDATTTFACGKGSSVSFII